jgi:hypothetical protein
MPHDRCHASEGPQNRGQLAYLKKGAAPLHWPHERRPELEAAHRVRRHWEAGTSVANHRADE